MKNDYYYFKISPEVLKKDIVQENYESVEFGLYKSMDYILENNLLGDLNLTIPLVQTIDDIGFYTPYDGYVEQLNKITNFIISGNPSNNYEVYFFDTSIKEGKINKDSEFTINWGDGIIETYNPFVNEYISHFYPVENQSYKITYTRKNKWGETDVIQTIEIPFNQNEIQGEIQNDSEPFQITGFTSSKLNELKRYGSVKFNFDPVLKKGEFYGQINVMNSEYTGYTINDIEYFDYPNGQTIFLLESNGLNEDNLVFSGTTKEEVLLGVVDSPEIQSEVFIDRGKLSGLENLQRLGEVDNVGDLQNYGYKYYKINNQ
jgi:hypothetical protein